MKKHAFGILAALFALTLALVADAYATDTETAELNAADVYAILYEDGEMVFQNSATPDGRVVKATYEVDLNEVYTSPYEANPTLTPWYNEKKSVCVVKFADKISPTSTAYWFYECYSLERMDNMQNLNTANVTDMCGMFFGCNRLTALDMSHFDTANVKLMNNMFAVCSRLTALDVSHFNTANVTYMSYMFQGCSNLKTIYVSDKFITTSVTYGNAMFSGCTSLIGGNGTKYDENHTDKEYAQIDNPPDAPGYFTAKDAVPVAYAITSVKMENGKLSVTLTNPGAATLAVSYFADNGKFVSAQLKNVDANAGTLALDLLTGAATLRVMLLDSDFRPVGLL